MARSKADVKEYSAVDRKRLVEKIEKLKKKEHYINVFRLISEDTDKYTVNSNGVWIVMNPLSDEIMHKIENYLQGIKRTEKRAKKLFIKAGSRSSSSSDGSSKSDPTTSTNETETFGNYGPKLSNRDKNIIKRYRYNKGEDDALYRDFDPKMLTTEKSATADE
jgi:hypothetical protein